MIWFVWLISLLRMKLFKKLFVLVSSIVLGLLFVGWLVGSCMLLGRWWLLCMCVGMFVLCLFDLLVSSVVSVVMVGCFMKCVSVVLLFSLCFIVSISCDISNEWLFSLKNDVLWLILFGVSLSNVVYILVRCIFSVLCGVLWVLFFVCDIGRCVSVVWLILLFGVVGNMLSVVMLYGIM